MKNNQKRTSFENKKTSKKSRVKENPESFFDNNPTWKFDMVDFDHSKWNIESCDLNRSQLFKKLRDFERMKWRDIIQTYGGKNRGTNHHYIDFRDMIQEAQERAKELNIVEHTDRLFSLRLQGKIRLFGILTDGIFRIVWYDNDHDICPSKLKNT
ncbi:hypothetical protein KBI51_03070 [Aerococcaceae bacterium zg-ZUI334]|uniref:hypothetical protein n=1 Tax=Aerococcaceae bacterium zg-252 TaxID=2796928 RepID=UPI001B9F562B|nr:hypothetical protein [Aerococcaceae bacterium zg-ZUI334]